MRLGGKDVSNDVVKNIAGGALAVTLVLALFTSVSTAILGLTSFCFGAALFSFILDVCPNNELPNFVAYLKKPKLYPDLEPPSNRNEPWRDIKLPKEIDEALAELYEHLHKDYVYSWYGQISYDEEFMLEIRTALRYATAVLLRRLGRLDLTTLITQKGIPIGLTHLDSFVRAKQYSETFKTSLNLQGAYYDVVGTHVHPATHSRDKEVRYVHDLTRRLLPFITPKNSLNCLSLKAFLTRRLLPFITPKNSLNCLSLKAFLNDLVAGAVLQPVMDILPDPDIINYILQVSFDDLPTKVFPTPTGDMVELLEGFTNVSQPSTNAKSALQLDLSAILKNQQALFAFMQYLKEEGAINQLQFCLSIEDFNKRILTELSENQLVDLHKEAMELFETYLKANAVHKVGVKEDLVRQIASILSGPPTDVVMLRTTEPLFGAYEEIYTNLESMCPAFHKSEQYYTFLLGRRVNDMPDALDKQESRSRSDFGTKTSEKIGKGIKSLKQGVMAKSLEGMVDPLDPAYDLTDLCRAEREENMSNCSSTIGDILEYKDLSAWRVTIPDLKARKDYFVFVIEVQRIDVAAKTSNADDLHWTVERRYTEFYNLEAKLTAFHPMSEFEDAKLPPRPKLFSGKGLDVLQAKKRPFEEYLKCLLQKPSLKNSDILFTFLTSSEEFTEAATSHLGLAKMIKNVPMKLTKERGQGLQPFIGTFVASTQSAPPRPRHDAVVTTEDYDMTSERIIFEHPLFRDNLGLRHPTGAGIPLGHCNKYFSGLKETNERGVFDTIIYLAVNVFRMSRPRIQMLSALRILLRNTVDSFVDYAIAAKLKVVLSVGRVAYICKLLEEAIFEDNERRTDEDKLARRKLALANMKCFLRPLIGAVVGGGSDTFDVGVETIFESFQNPVVNKHLAFVLFDAALAELFPELLEEK